MNSKLLRKVANIRESVNGKRTVASALDSSSLHTHVLCYATVIEQLLTVPVCL